MNNLSAGKFKKVDYKNFCDFVECNDLDLPFSEKGNYDACFTNKNGEVTAIGVGFYKNMDTQNLYIKTEEVKNV